MNLRKIGYWLSVSILVGFAFLAGVGSAKSIWGGVAVLVMLAALWGVFELHED